MPKLVELYMLDNYEGLHAFETVKKIIWQNRGFVHLDKSKSESWLLSQDSVEEINKAMGTGQLKEVS